MCYFKFLLGKTRFCGSRNRSIIYPQAGSTSRITPVAFHTTLHPKSTHSINYIRAGQVRKAPSFPPVEPTTKASKAHQKGIAQAAATLITPAATATTISATPATLAATKAFVISEDVQTLRRITTLSVTTNSGE